MYIPTPAHQTYVFLMCIGFGFALGIFYDLVRLLRKSFFTFKKALLIQDVLYCIISTFAVFCFLLCVNDGEIRFFTIFGLVTGWIIYYFTFGSLVVKITDEISSAVRYVMRPVRKIVVTAICRIRKYSKKTSKNIENKPDNT